MWLLNDTDSADRVLLGNVTFAEGKETLAIALVDPAPNTRAGDRLVAPSTDDAWFQLTE